jgi:DNA-binding beta-propeller fold protein YncE
MTADTTGTPAAVRPVGQGRYRYTPDSAWPRLPDGCLFAEAAAVAADSRGRVYVFHRGPHRVLVFDRDGTYVTAWGENLFARPHGLFVGPDDLLYVTDDVGHTVRKFTAEGQLLLTLGVSGRPSDTGATSMDYRTIRRAGPPFHYPTNVALSPAGELYVSDGYGNARVHKFAPDGRLLLSWGEPGAGPGQFHLPHGIAVDRAGTVYVADRENSRVQLFTPEGEYLTEWTDVARPCQVFIDPEGAVFVAELGYRVAMWPGTRPPSPDAPGGRVSVFSPEGRLLARWGGGERPGQPGDFLAPHGLWVDGRGDVYVAEVTRSAGANAGPGAVACRPLQKFVRHPEAA